MVTGGCSADGEEKETMKKLSYQFHHNHDKELVGSRLCFDDGRSQENQQFLFRDTFRLVLEQPS